MTDGLHQAEQTADRIRSELLQTLEELDRRRHEAVDWRFQIRSNWPLVSAAAGVAAAMVAGRVLIARIAKERRTRHRWRRRMGALRRFWEDPDSLAPPRPSLPVEWGTNLVSIFGNEFAGRVSRKLAMRVVG
jgi:hypothetical protein